MHSKMFFLFSCIYVSVIVLSFVETAPLLVNSPEKQITIQSTDTQNLNENIEKNKNSPMTIIYNGPPKTLSGTQLHIAPGAYPVYYSLARANGRFGKYIRALSAAEIERYNVV